MINCLELRHGAAPGCCKYYTGWFVLVHFYYHINLSRLDSVGWFSPFCDLVLNTIIKWFLVMLEKLQPTVLFRWKMPWIGKVECCVCTRCYLHCRSNLALTWTLSSPRPKSLHYSAGMFSSGVSSSAEPAVWHVYIPLPACFSCAWLNAGMFVPFN